PTLNRSPGRATSVSGLRWAISPTRRLPECTASTTRIERSRPTASGTVVRGKTIVSRSVRIGTGSLTVGVWSPESSRSSARSGSSMHPPPPRAAPTSIEYIQAAKPLRAIPAARRRGRAPRRGRRGSLWRGHERAFVSATSSRPARRARLRPTLRAVLYLVAFVVGSGAAQIAVALLLSLAGLGALLEGLTPIETRPIVLALYAPVLLAVVAATWLFVRQLDRRRLVELGLAARGAWLRELAGGVGLGALLMALVFVVELGAGGYHLIAFGWE